MCPHILKWIALIVIYEHFHWKKLDVRQNILPLFHDFFTSKDEIYLILSTDKKVQAA